MTQRQRAIEIIHSAKLNHPDDRRTISEVVADALLASDFCSDSVRELVKKVNGKEDLLWGILTDEKDLELLRKIVED